MAALPISSVACRGGVGRSLRLRKSTKSHAADGPERSENHGGHQRAYPGCRSRRAPSGPQSRQALAGSRISCRTRRGPCEFVWVLRRGYKKSASEISAAIHRLTKSVNVVVNRPAVEAGLAVLEAGGDFADGIIAHEGNWLGAEELVSFDAKAVSLLQSQDVRARLL